MSVNNAARIRGGRTTVCLLLLLLASCSSGSDVSTAKVTGQVKLNGKPLAGALIQFQPEDGRSSYAETDEQGNYTLNYSASQQGATVGHHRVVITSGREVEIPAKPASEGGDSSAPPQNQLLPELLPKRYHSESTLTAVVENKRENIVNFDLTSP